MTTNEWKTIQRFIERWQNRVLFEDRGKLKERDKVVAIAYSRYFHRDRASDRFGAAWVAQETIAERTSLSPDQVNRAISNLRKYGYLCRLGKTGMNGTVICKFTLPDTDEDLSWLDSLKSRERQGEDVDQPEAHHVPEMDQDVTPSPINSRESPSSDTGIFPSSSSGESPNNPLEGLPARSSPANQPVSGGGCNGDFLDVERRHRGELINYWIMMGPDDGTSYWHAVTSFAAAFVNENRTEWISTFKHFMARVDESWEDNDDPVNLAIQWFEEEIHRDESHRRRFAALDFQARWAGRTDKVEDAEYRRAWERLLCRYDGQVIIDAVSSSLVRGKYPRETVEIDLASIYLPA